MRINAPLSTFSSYKLWSAGLAGVAPLPLPFLHCSCHRAALGKDWEHFIFLWYWRSLHSQVINGLCKCQYQNEMVNWISLPWAAASAFYTLPVCCPRTDNPFRNKEGLCIQWNSMKPIKIPGSLSMLFNRFGSSHLWALGKSVALGPFCRGPSQGSASHPDLGDVPLEGITVQARGQNTFPQVILHLLRGMCWAALIYCTTSWHHT